MIRTSATIGTALAVLALATAPALGQDKPVERRGTTVRSPSEDSILNPKNLTKELSNLGPMKVVKVHSIQPPAATFDAKNFRSDTSGLGDVCFTKISPFVPYQDSFTEKLETERAMTCEKRDSIVKALGFTSVFLKGTSMICSFAPVPQVQLTAKIIDIASYATSTVALVISTTTCENTLEVKFNALLKTCDDLKAMNVDCQGVDNEPF